MRPVTYEDAVALSTHRKILLVDVGGHRNDWVRGAALGGLIRSRGKGVKLPPELWLEICDLGKSEEQQVWAAVLPDRITLDDVATKAVIECIEVDASPGVSLEDAESVLRYEQLLADPDQAMANVKEEDEDGNAVYLAPFIGGPAKHRSPLLCSIAVGASYSGQDAVAPRLFIDLEMADWVARKENGVCGVCDEERTICPGCTRGYAEAFDVNMGCGPDLACPLCIGLRFSWEDKEYWRRALRNAVTPEEHGARKRRFVDRLAELGYEWGETNEVW